MPLTLERLAQLRDARDSRLPQPRNLSDDTPIGAVMRRFGRLTDIADRFCVTDLEPIVVGAWALGMAPDDVQIAVTFDDDMDVSRDLAGLAAAVSAELGYPVVPFRSSPPARDTITVRAAAPPSSAADLV